MCLRLHIRVKLSVHHYLIEEREQSKKAEGQVQGTRWELEQPGAGTGVQEEPEAGKKERDSCPGLELEQLQAGRLVPGELEQVRATTVLEEQEQGKIPVGRELEQEQDMTPGELGQEPGRTAEADIEVQVGPEVGTGELEEPVVDKKVQGSSGRTSEAQLRTLK